VHSFPTNSVLLRGLTEYLDDFFQVHFIDLPGFTKDVSPLKEISLDGYCRFVETQIKELALDNYIAAGVSFGFMVVNGVQHNKSCRGILGIVPYMGPGSLRQNGLKRRYYRTVVKAVCWLGVWDAMWKSRMVRRYLSRTKRYRPEVLATILEQIDSRTFFETALLLLSDDQEPVFQKLPYVLLPSTSDETIDYRCIHRVAANGGEDVLVMDLDVDHYPQDLSRAYFESRIPGRTIEDMKRFFARRGPLKAANNQ
jgi:hypothetical protein